MFSRSTTANEIRRGLGLVAIVCASASFLSACGTHPTTGVRRLRATQAPVATAPTPAMTPVAGTTDPQAQALLAQVGAAKLACRNYTAIAETKGRTPAGGVDRNKCELSWKRPGIMAANVLGSDNAKKTGTKLIYDGKREVKVKTYFFGFIPLKITLDVEDSRLVDGYKRSLHDTSTEMVMDTLLHPQATVRYIGEGTAAGEAVAFLEVRSPLKWKNVDYDVFGISRRLNLPIMRDAIDMKGKVLFHMEMKNMKVNTTIPASTWLID